MDIQNLNDIELKKSLENLGVNCGPVTSTTRKVYEKKLVKLLSANEPEIVESREVYAQENEVVVTQKKTRESKRIAKTIEVQDFDTPFVSNDSFSSPRSYVPDGSNLTRRPLSTPHRSSKKVTHISKTSQVASPADKPGSRFAGCCRMLLPVLVVVAILVLLVYYHMEDFGLKELTKE